MTDIANVTAVWEGFAGGPGTNTFYFADGLADLDDLQTFYGTMLALIPDAVHIILPTTGSVVDDASGDLTGNWFADATAPLVGGGTSAYASGVGAIIRWNTIDVSNSRVIKGRTFIVPMLSSAFDTDGSLTVSAQGVIQGAADALIAAYAGELKVWHRPVSGAGGSVHDVVSATVPDRPALLASRRR